MTTYSNVWDALFDNKEIAENLRIRSELMIEITKYLNQFQLTQKQAAEEFGISQPRLSNLKNGQIDKFTIDMLVNILSKTGALVHFTVIQSAEVEEKSSPWQNFHILEGGKRRKRPIKKFDWGVSICEPCNIVSIG